MNKDVRRLAAVIKEPMAKIANESLQEGVKKQKKHNTSGVKVLLALSKMGLTGGEDTHLSENIDYYIYKAPKRHE